MTLGWGLDAPREKCIQWLGTRRAAAGERGANPYSRLTTVKGEPYRMAGAYRFPCSARKTSGFEDPLVFAHQNSPQTPKGAPGAVLVAQDYNWSNPK